MPIILIPARMTSVRLPGKPLALIHGVPMVVHVARRAVAADVGAVVVACAEAEIAEAVEAHGLKAVLTRPDHASGSDRVFEALEAVDPDGAHEIVINLQGDLPTLPPAYIRTCAGLLADDPDADIATLANPITDPEDIANPNVVKPVMTQTGERRGRALYFTRLPAPGGEGAHYHHIGIYAYRRAALARFVVLPPSPLEQRERLEQLRALEAGMRIAVGIVPDHPPGVDTPEDLKAARRLLEKEG